jgi:hypothetical protein
MLSEACKDLLRAWVRATDLEGVEDLCARLRRGDREAAACVAAGLEDAAARDGLREAAWEWTRERNR